MADIKNLQTIEQEKIIKPEEIKETGAVEQAPSIPEKAFEQAAVSEKKEALPAEEAAKAGRETAGIAPVQPIKKEEEERKRKIEEILAKNLENIYANMPIAKQQEFRIEGEKTAAEINTLLSQTKVKLNKIVNLIKKWLSLIPGVNKFFLEQESKIKADQLFKLRERK